jgi:putative inorganic carbon (hco3(-)) transporter
VTLTVGTCALVMTFSRGAWINFVVGSALVMVVLVGKAGLRSRALIWGVASVVVIATVVLTFSGLVASRIFSDDKGSVQNRLHMNDLALRMIYDNPWLGVGVNTYGLRMAEYDQFYLNPQNVVHNVYLFTAAESGVFAVLAFIWLFIALARQGVRGIRLKSLYLSTTATAMLGGIVGLALHMIAEMLVAGPPILAFWLFAGLLAGINNLARHDMGEPVKFGRSRQGVHAAA